jgi:UDP-hydrolysing UDP-N-acetyl-D-glucosamine 2-epimerase
LVVLGDRFEMHAAALAALHFSVPVAHIHGGELTQGAIDDSLRHGITKMSHLHFAATTEYGHRILRLGEEPWRVTVSGAPSLDNLRELKLPSREVLQQQVGLEFGAGPLIVTYHPVTLDQVNERSRVDELLQALDQVPGPMVFTAPNADVGGALVRARITEFVSGRKDSVFVESLGTHGYFGLMANAKVMIGNSSSGIIEAASFGLPVVNVGTRQLGRMSGENVIRVGDAREEILDGIETATSEAFRERAKRCSNPYGDGSSAKRIVRAILNRAEDRRLLLKDFYEGPTELEGAWDE